VNFVTVSVWGHSRHTPLVKSPRILGLELVRIVLCIQVVWLSELGAMRVEWKDGVVRHRVVVELSSAAARAMLRVEVRHYLN
jgi:hypothetical protein